ncbi:MAG: M48 family metalloprotease, partial [Mailhella sp.]|nr:M48 family metalloprotease [Mailhella sp.]
GTIIVFRGLLEKHNDDELAWVIAHELGHGVAHHSAEMLSKAIIQELAIDSFIDKDSGLLKIAGTHIAAFITNLKYSRTCRWPPENSCG